MSLENSNEQFKKAPRLHLGKNTCSECGKDFIVAEHELEMPGTKDLESVFCPYCNTYNGEVFINGIARAEKVE
jgi:DNA-directed RNA polymerase subunit RPC12/RpoP